MTAEIFEIKRFAVHDGDGIRTTVFFKGCTLRCKWCHNPEGLCAGKQLAFFKHNCIDCGLCVKACSKNAHIMENGTHRFIRERCAACGNCVPACPTKALQLYGKTVKIHEITDILLLDRAFYQKSGGGVTLSGGECLMQHDACAQILRSMKEHNVHTAVDTAGCVPQTAIEKVAEFTDLFLYDIKHSDSAMHKGATGKDNSLILSNLKYLSESGAKIEIRIPLIPDFNDNDIDNIAAIIAGLKGITKVKVLPYNDYAGSKYGALDYAYTKYPKNSPESVENARRLLKKRGISVSC